MRRIYSICIALFFCLMISLIGNYAIKKNIIYNSEKLIYANNEKRNIQDFLMDRIIKRENMVVLGSSELFPYDCINCTAHPNYLYKNVSDYNVIQIGRGNTQSLFHAISVGALSNNIKNDKIVLIISPQWFTNPNINSEIFSSRFLERMYVEFIKNDKVSKSVKLKVSSRVESLLSADEKEQKKIIEMDSIYINRSYNFLNYLKYGIYNSFMGLKEAYNFYKDMKDYYSDTITLNNKISAEEIDYQSLLIEAEKNGTKECTNNDYGIYDDYFNQYIKDVYDQRKDSQINSSYTISEEYNDLRLFLDVCSDLDLDVMLVSVPVNGKWYDYTGFPKDDREKYYENIRQISKEYNVKLADFSDKEYEKYFLRDIMHLGWKGWVYVDEAIYKFYKGEF